MKTVWCNVFVLAACVSFFAQSAFSADVNDSNQVISAIRVEGNVSVKAQEVLAKIRTRQGEEFNPAVATDDVKRIAEIKGPRSRVISVGVAVISICRFL